MEGAGEDGRVVTFFFCVRKERKKEERERDFVLFVYFVEINSNKNFALVLFLEDERAFVFCVDKMKSGRETEERKILFCFTAFENQNERTKNSTIIHYASSPKRG